MSNIDKQEIFKALENIGNLFDSIRIHLPPALVRFNEWCEKNMVGINKFTDAMQLLNENLNRAMSSRQKLIDIGYKGGGYILPLSYLHGIENMNEEEILNQIYGYTISEDYINDFIELANNSISSNKRTELIAEGLLLHKEGRFGGAATLVLSQIEGIVSDHLVACGIGQYSDNGELIVDRKKVIGVHNKIEKLKLEDPEREWLYEELLKNAFIREAMPQGFNKIRNSILHGSDTQFATKEISTQIVLWLYTIMNELIMDNIENK